MTHYRVTLAYDGTDFHGWQAQSVAGGHRTVQGVVEAALSRLAGGGTVRIAGAGRTDRGVHAWGQVASFDLPREIPPEDLARALNALLPGDVRVLGTALAPPVFHARRSALDKSYRYVLDQGGVRLPARRRSAGWIPWRLDRDRVAEAAGLFLGRHDFASLASSGGGVKTMVRCVTRSEARFLDGAAGAGAAVPAATGSTLIYDVTADGFLRKMVRSLVGGLVAAGRGSVTVDDLRRALDARDRRAWPPPAEACGLTLVSVRYPEAPV
jgi:tRNA pseudouridine38-40 synthase